MASFNGPKLTNPIRTDVPDTQEVLVALAKQDPTSISDIPVGAKRLYEASSGKWQWQLYNGTSWAPVPFLQHNVDQLDGYHAAITPAANTVAVRNASGLLQDSITGNAATASSAATLSQTLPVNKGGTGATTSEAARANLGVPPTSHASTNTTHGVGNATQYGHLKLSDDTNSSSGVTGGVAATPAAVKAAKGAADAAQSSANNAQSSADAAMTKASTLATSSVAGIVKPGTGMTVDAAGALNVEASSASTPGIVKSSVTAQAGVAPIGGADGSLGEDWLKKAMEAAKQAQASADAAGGDKVKSYIVDTWKSNNGLSWYRKWSDGWIEQGGVVNGRKTTSYIVTLPTKFSNTNYVVTFGQYGVQDAGSYAPGLVEDSKTTTTFSYTGLYTETEIGNGVSWYACGF